MIKHALIILILLHSIAIANQLQGEYRLICVTQSLEKSLDFPSSKKIKVVEDGGKYFLLSEEPLLEVSTGNSSVSCDLKNEIIFSKSNGAFRIILTVRGEESIYTKIFRGKLNKADSLESSGIFFSIPGTEGKFIITD